MGMECYSEHLIELEWVVSEHQPHGPVIIMEDFNEHLGTLGGERGTGQPNQQGILLHQLITRCNLYAVSLSSLSQGPAYTFQNSVFQTTVDYVLANHDATEYIRHCYTHDSAPLNTSDHLPITAVLQFQHSTVNPQGQSTRKRINWSKVCNSTYLLDVPFVSEEVDGVLKKLKLSKAAGHDGLRAEYLKYGGPMLRDWILQVCNAIVDVESIPNSLKTGIITPVYKGCGKDPSTLTAIVESH